MNADPHQTFDIGALPGCAIEKALALLPRREILFDIWKQETAEEARAEYGRPQMRDFRAAAFEECHRALGVSKQDFLTVTRGYNIHHKRPRGFGGGNEFSNLVLIEQSLHRSIHKDIKRTADAISEIERLYARGEPVTRTQARAAVKKLAKAGGATSEVAKTDAGEVLSRDEALHAIEGLRLDAKGRIFVTIPWPEGTVCIPELIVHLAQRGERPARQSAPQYSSTFG